jgi:signal transduction histidine kinase/CheY-like chemotaxis protein
VNEQSAPEERASALERELAEVSEQQAVTVQLLKSIGESTFDLVAVFDMVLRNAVRLCRADGGHIWRFEVDRYRPVHNLGGSDEYRDFLSRHSLLPGRETVVGKVALERRTVHLDDVLSDPDYSSPEMQRLGGYRTLLGVPMMREGNPIGVITLWRTRVDPFTDRQIQLVSTFAAQGAIAIANVELLRELDEKNRQLEIASHHKSEFLAHMSHELRTPLNAVIGFSEVLLERMFGDLNAKQDEYLNDILSSGRHLLDLINDVLDVSKVEAGGMKLDLGSISLPAVVRDALVLVREQADQRRLTLTINVDNDLPEVPGDERRIKQVVTNLVSNAVKFTPEGGRIDVSARLVDGETHVSVADTGVGIAAADQESIFDSFQQVSHGPDPKPEGTGLGLTLSRQIVVLHGGRMWVDSDVDAGSTFTFALPVGGPLAPEPAELAPEPAVSSEHEGTTALIVEDDEHSIDLLSLYLRDAGFEVAVARDGAAGLELARTLRPAGILLDILLPRLDGWEFLARAKADPELADLPIIIVSMVDERGKGLALGAADYLVKPVGREDLLGALARVTALPAHAKVLAIDDDPMAIELIEAVLEPAGYDVVTARSGEAGVALARAELPDVVLLDLVMPEVDGFMVVEHLRADPITSGIPIIVLTSKTLTAKDKERLKGRIAHVAEKAEFSRAALLALVARFAPAKVL